MKNIVVLISGKGSNLQAIWQASQQQNWHQNLGANIVAVVSNNPQAAGLHWASKQGIATAVVNHKDFATREQFDTQLATTIDKFNPSLVVLAGFMRILTPNFVKHYANRLINIHPSLLPLFKGTNTHQRAIDAGCNQAGATVHEVTAELDSGAIIAQVAIPILANDDAQSLALRVLEQEHLLYPSAIVQKLKNLPS